MKAFPDKYNLGRTLKNAALDGRNRLNEKRIQQVLEIEKQANEALEAAKKQAELLPVQAEKEAQASIEKIRSDAQEEARQIAAKSQAEEECANILAKAEENIRQTDALATSKFDRAVHYVISRVVGRE